jgi:AbrB family looped-hinge helix DNA binding protein
MRITSKGQVTIPQDVRERAGLMPGTDVEFQVDAKGVVRVLKAEARRGKKSRGGALVSRLRGQGAFAMTTDEVLALMRGPPPDDDTRRRR